MFKELKVNSFRGSCISLNFSWWRPLSYRNQSIDLQSNSMDWFLYDNGLHHERVKKENLLLQHIFDILKTKINCKYTFIMTKYSIWCKINRISFRSILSANSKLYFLQEIETSVHPLQFFLNFPVECGKTTFSKYSKFYTNYLSESYPLKHN